MCCVSRRKNGKILKMDKKTIKFCDVFFYIFSTKKIKITQQKVQRVYLFKSGFILHKIDLGNTGLSMAKGHKINQYLNKF